MQKPKYLFEVSWEIANKIGGIYTVLSTKSPHIQKELGDRYILIGPDVWKETHSNPDFIEDNKLFPAWMDIAREEGLYLRMGRWNIPGKPLVILVDFTNFFPKKNEIFASYWESFQLDSLHGQWDYVEPALFGYAAARVIMSFYKHATDAYEGVVAHFHEWMTGTGVLELKKHEPAIGIAFTTHATILGRSIAGNGLPLYDEMKKVDPPKMAEKFGIQSKYSLETTAAHQADAFTTVSRITADECAYLLRKEVDVVTENGFNSDFVPSAEVLKKNKSESAELLRNVASRIFESKVSDQALLVLTSGRYEFRNKGLDVFIDALQLMKNANHKRELVAFVMVPAHHAGPVSAFLDRKPAGHSSDRYLTHYLHSPGNDPVLNRLRERGITNEATDTVKVLFVPAYMDGHDGVFNKTYYELLPGFDISFFPSYYEPWGYTPLESLAFGVPTLTTSLSGFGKWIREKESARDEVMYVIERHEHDHDRVVHQIVEVLKKSLDNNNDFSSEAIQIAKTALWDQLIENYWQTYEKVLKKLDARPKQYKEKPGYDMMQQISTAKTDLPNWKRLAVSARLPKKLDALIKISKNLWWCWNYEAIELFEKVHPVKWIESHKNPIVLLESLDLRDIKSLEANQDFLTELSAVSKKFDDYMATPKKAPRIGYFSMEYGLENNLKTYSGGLGILAGDYLKQASDSAKDLFAVGLLYRYGYFTQTLSVGGEQIAEYLPQKFSNLPLNPVMDEEGEWMKVEIALPGRNLTAKVWMVAVGRIPLYLLDTDISENTAADRAITHQLYGGNWENRFLQEMLLGIGGVRMIHKMGLHADVYHSNEGHSAFSGLERLRFLVQEEKIEFETAREIVKSSTLFTTHTPVPAGHDYFEEHILRTYMSHYPGRLNISWNEFMGLGRYDVNNHQEKFSMSVLALKLSQEVNGVSKIHGKVTREMFNSLFPGYYPRESYISHVTNGVHLPSWTDKRWQQLYADTMGLDYLSNQYNPEYWDLLKSLPAEKFWEIRQSIKTDLIAYLKERIKNDMMLRQESPTVIFNILESINEKALIIGFARRFATYKRAHLLFNNLEKLSGLLNMEGRPLIFVFAGKAHPQDGAGQGLIKRIIEISRMPQFIGKVLFIENYDMELGNRLTSGVDIWLNTPTRPMEASGTSGEKAVMNGVLNLSILDGWWAEGYTPGAGWAIQQERTYTNQQFQDELDAETIYNLLENEILPMYHDKTSGTFPKQWAESVKSCIIKIAPRFTMQRMLDDYYNQFYYKLDERGKMIEEDNYEKAKTLALWRQQIAESWNNLEVESLTIPDSSRKPLELGKHFIAELRMYTNGIKAEEIRIEIIFIQRKIDRSIRVAHQQTMELKGKEGEMAVWSCDIPITIAGNYDYSFRLTPQHKWLAHPQDIPLVKWV